MGAGGLVMMGGATIFSGMSGGLNAKAQQQKIKESVCQMYKQMVDYKQAMATEVSILSSEASEAQQAAQNIMTQVSQIQSQIRLDHSNFKNTYNTWVIICVIFLIILVFIFASKKFILHATTEPSS